MIVLSIHWQIWAIEREDDFIPYEIVFVTQDGTILLGDTQSGDYWTTGIRLRIDAWNVSKEHYTEYVNALCKDLDDAFGTPE